MSDNYIKVRIESEANTGGFDKGEQAIKKVEEATASLLTAEDRRARALAQNDALAAKAAETQTRLAAALREVAVAQTAAAQTAASGDGVGAGIGSLLVVAGAAGGIAGLAASAVREVATVAMEYVANITTAIENETQATLKESVALQKQSEDWANLAKAANSFHDVLNLQQKTGSEIGKLKEQMEALDASTGSWVDKFKIFANSDGPSVIGKVMGLITTEHEKQIDKLKTLIQLEETRARKVEAQASARARENRAIENLPPVERLGALNDKMMGMQAHQSALAEDSPEWNREQLEIDGVRTKIAQVTAEVERLIASREREGQALDDNMRKEGEKFTKEQEATRAREGKLLDKHMGELGKEFLDAQKAAERGAARAEKDFAADMAKIDKEVDAEEKKAAAAEAALRIEQEEHGILVAKLAGNTALAAELERQKNLHAEIARLVKDGVPVEEATAEANITAELNKQIAAKKTLNSMQSVKDADSVSAAEQGGSRKAVRDAKVTQYKNERMAALSDAHFEGADIDPKNPHGQLGKELATFRRKLRADERAQPRVPRPIGGPTTYSGTDEPGHGLYSGGLTSGTMTGPDSRMPETDWRKIFGRGISSQVPEPKGAPEGPRADGSTLDARHCAGICGR